MRIRTVKPEFFTHADLFDAEKESDLPLRVAFIGLWCACDREGRFKWEPRRLGVLLLPYDNIDFSRVLDALTTRGFVIKYRVGNDWFGCVPSFTAHQVINNRETLSQLPDVSEAEELAEEELTRDPRVATRGQNGKAEGNGKEGNMEGNGKELVANASSTADESSSKCGSLKKSKPSKQTPEQFIESLKANPAFRHINVEVELGKMDAWLSTRPGKQKTPRFVVNWLNRIQSPIPVQQARPVDTSKLKGGVL